MTTHPFYCHPWPITLERLALLKQAKASLELDYLIEPQAAFPGVGERVLAFGARPPFACESAVVVNETFDAVRAAMAVVLSADPDPRMWTYEEWFSDVMGVDVRFSHTEDRTGMVMFSVS